MLDLPKVLRRMQLDGPGPGDGTAAIYKPVEGWEAVHRVYGEYQRYGIKAVESYEIISCPEYVSDGSDSRRSRFHRGWEKELDDERSI